MHLVFIHAVSFLFEKICSSHSVCSDFLFSFIVYTHFSYLNDPLSHLCISFYFSDERNQLHFAGMEASMLNRESLRLLMYLYWTSQFLNLFIVMYLQCIHPMRDDTLPYVNFTFCIAISNLLASAA